MSLFLSEEPNIDLSNDLHNKTSPAKINELLKKPNLFLSSDESDQFVHNFISENEKSLKLSPKNEKASFLCSEHNLPIDFFCTVHLQYLCQECRKDHLSHIRSLEKYDLVDLQNNFQTIEEKFTKLKTLILEHQNSLKGIIENETNKSEDITIVLKKIYQFLSSPIIKSEIPLRRRRSRSLKKTPPPSKSIEMLNTFNKISKPTSKPKQKIPKIKEIIPLTRLITDKEDQSFIKLILDPHLKKNEGLNLIFTASKDGFRVSDFHRCCDNKSRTLVIIKSNFGNIFGGFASHPWQWPDKGQFVEDPDAFLYSLTYHTKHKQIKNNEYALYLSRIHGPVFGTGFDLCVKDECNRKFQNYCRLGNSYYGPVEYSLEDNYCYLGGSEHFSIDEYEVLEIIELN